MAKRESEFTTDAKIIGVKVKPNLSTYNSEGNKIELTLEVTMPRPAFVRSFAQWSKSNSYDEGPGYDLKQALQKAKAALAGEGTPAKAKKGKKGAAVEAEAEPASRAELEESLAAIEAKMQEGYAKYEAKAVRNNQRAQAAANHAGLFMALGGQMVRVSIAPQQSAMPGMLALPMPDAIEEYDEDEGE